MVAVQPAETPPPTSSTLEKDASADRPPSNTATMDSETTGDAPSKTVTMGSYELVLKGEDCHAFRCVDVGGEQLHLGMVADGHGGKECSRLCKKLVLDRLVAALEGGAPSGSALQAAGGAAFLAAHEQMLADTSSTAGSTLTVVALNASRAELTVLHAGDSVARLVGRKKTVRALCDDHRIESSAAERERLTALGGKLARAMDAHGRPGGPLRLWPPNSPGVAQARAIGDRDIGVFIDARPHAVTVALPPAESCAVVLASDGIWDAMLPNAVGALARGTLGAAPSTSARIICMQALATRHAYSSDGDEVPIDDTTCVVLHLLDEDDPIAKPFFCG
jgi:serine/threonine protein phosphatase PrpC